MRNVTWLIFITLGLAINCSAQNNSNNTYAVIVGISKYENENIKSLVYSDKDAQLFTQWLQSNSGGNVPASHMRVLINEQATLAAVYNAMDWLKEQCKEGDVAYVYFSGHGDLETGNKDNKGYLLAYNTPPHNYPNNALAVEQLNNDANFLTLQKKVKVVLITDACHSGKLAGDFFKGKQWVAQQLQQVLHQEIRLTACAADEEAAEGEFWGGGRGIFSYYLLMGMYGMADGLNDGTVTFKELQQFIDSSFKADEYLQLQKHKQTPVTDGNPVAFMSNVDNSALKKYQLQQQGAASTVLLIDYYFEKLKAFPLNSLIDFDSLPSITDPSFPLHVIDACMKNQETFEAEKIRVGTYFEYFAHPDSLKFFREQLLSDASLQKQFKQRFEQVMMDYFFKSAAAYPLESFIQFKALPTLTETSFPLHIINACIRFQDSVDALPILETTPAPASFADVAFLKILKQLLNDVMLQKQFTQLFVEQVHNNVQSMINAYLNGEEAELEKRQYYYSGARNYSDFLPVIKTALSLIPSNHHMADVLQINQHYLSGVLARMQMATSKKTDSLLKAAFRHQYKTLELQPYAAYVHNELANLYVHQKRFDSAQYHFDFASALASTWAIPWSNQIRMNMMLKNYSKAKTVLHKADSLQPDLSYVYMNAGILMERENQLLDALSYFSQATILNPVHFLPFERLGHLYLQLGDYKKANSFLFKASSLKNSFTVNDDYFRYGVELGGLLTNSIDKIIDSCFVQIPEEVQEKQPAWLLLKTISKDKSISADAYISQLRRVIQQQPELPLVHHYLGKKLLEQGNTTEAILILQTALQRYKSNDELQKIEVVDLLKNQDSLYCIRMMFHYYNYEVVEDFYLLAKAYEFQKMFKEATDIYEQVQVIENKLLMEQAVFKDYIEIERRLENEFIPEASGISPFEYLLNRYELPVKITAAIQLMKLYEHLQDYEKAESIILQQVARSRKAGDMRRKAVEEHLPGTWKLSGIKINFFWIKANHDLEITVHDFYLRMMELQPRNYYWKQQAALFLYNRLQLAYKQMPQEQYVSFTNSLENYAYPWNTSEEPFGLQVVSWPIPGLKDTVVIKLEAFHPVYTALQLLQRSQALSPLKEPELQTAIMFADMYNWAGNAKESKYWYEYILQKQNQDTATRLKLIHLLLNTGNFTKAKFHLDTLEQQNSLDSAGLQHLLFFYTAAGNFEKAEMLIKNTSVVTIQDSCRQTLQRAQLLFMQKKYTEVLTLLKKQFPSEPINQNWDDSEELQSLFARRYYFSARCYALLKQDAIAVSFLKKALEKGFCLEQVLKYDPVWSLIKKGVNRKLFQEQTDKANCTGEVFDGGFINPIIYRIPDEKKQHDY